MVREGGRKGERGREGRKEGWDEVHRKTEGLPTI